MRRIAARPALPPKTIAKLNQKTTDIKSNSDPAARAATLWKSTRGTVWFGVLVNTVAAMSGLGQRCMYCSGSESAQVEHYEPKAIIPARTFDWANHLWVCGICNLSKGDRLRAPASTPPLALPIDPTVDDPWKHFYIDQYGNLSPRWDPLTNALDARAVWTIELLGLDRQALQESRQARLLDLREKVEDALQLVQLGTLKITQVEKRVLHWFEQPFQPDIADYFLAGPGATEQSERFKDLLALI